MKTDDDAFVRIDEILISLNRMNASHGLLYGLINSDSQPHRNPDSKWYISPEVPFFSEISLFLTIEYTTKILSLDVFSLSTISLHFILL